MKKKLLLIGAGPTSSLIAYSIARCQTLRDIFEIHIWEKSRGTGGRFSTSRSPKNPNCYSDLGAQYLTCSGQPFSKPYFENLLEHGLIRPFDSSKISGFRQDPGKTNYVCSSGTASIVKHFFEKGNGGITFDKRVDGVFSNGDNKIEVHSEQGHNEIFDFVISTMPVPQILQLKNMDILLKGKDGLKSKLESVKYTSRYALGLFYDTKDVSFKTTPQAINFVPDDPVIRYWSIENLKRASGSDTSEPCSLVVHSSTEYGAENVEETPDSMKSSFTEKALNVLEITSKIEPAFIKCHKWRYSQVDNAFPEQPGFVEITQNFIAAGDGLSFSGFEGCITSAEKTVALLRTLA